MEYGLSVVPTAFAAPGMFNGALTGARALPPALPARWSGAIRSSPASCWSVSAPTGSIAWAAFAVPRIAIAADHGRAFIHRNTAPRAIVTEITMAEALALSRGHLDSPAMERRALSEADYRDDDLGAAHPEHAMV